MADRIGHRGPDASGLQDMSPHTSLQLAHRRLSIIDLSTASDQPFVKAGLHLSYNGELYNYRDLRAILRTKGVQFVTESDTEVVLECWREWGPDALSRFRGMFAFAIYDERTGALTLARDPLGIKPMYVMPRGSGIVFASELKALVAAVGPELTIDPGALVASTMFYFLPEEQCAIKGVAKLPPGSWAEWRADGTTRAGRYWEPAQEAHAAASGPPADLAAVLEESVAAHLVADVPVASFLSGGLDSSLITAMAASRDPSIEAYTITFRPEDQRLEAMPDDAVYARKMAAHLGIRLHEIEISPDVVDMLPRVVDVLDEPIGDPAAINTILMCQAARDAGVKVLLSGMGADELFGGYRKHLACVLGTRTSVQPLGQALPQLRRAAGGGGVSPQLQPLRPGRARGPARSRAVSSCAGRRGRPSQPLQRRPSARSRQPHVPHGHPSVPPGTQPGLYRSVEHGGVDGGAGALRRPLRVQGGFQLQRQPQDPGTDAKGPSARRRRVLGAA
jgi:asparagine synthase (glutamine-hydrolysing)